MIAKQKSILSYLIIVCVGLLFVGCFEKTTETSDTSPNIEITKPEEGFVWGDTIEIKVNATDNDGIDRVVILIDSIFVSEDHNEPYSYLWDTADYTIGNHNIEAKCYDYNGKSSSTNVRVTLSPCPIFEEDLQDFEGITETDTEGNLIGNIDLDDWHFEIDTLFSKSIVKDDTIPVELLSFTVSFVDYYIIIRWTTASETDVNGFNIYRNSEDNFDTATQINAELIPGHGTTTEPNDYEFIDDNNIEPETTYYYWLECVYLSGETDFYGSISIITPAFGGLVSYSFGPAYPNPCENECSIPFALPESSEITIIIIDEDGEFIEILINQHMSAGYHSIVWNTLENNKLYRCIFHQSDSNHWHGDILF